MDDATRDRRRLVFLGVLFEGGLALVAWALGRALGVSPWATLHWEAGGLARGIVATLPMLPILRLGLQSNWRPPARIRAFIDEVIRPLLRPCSPAELALLALAAGVGEEALFRGVIQGALGRAIGPGAGLAVASLLFGLLHPITPAYVLLAAGLGAYLGWIWTASGNLLVVIVAHALYDWLA